MIRHITEDIEIFSGDSDEENLSSDSVEGYFSFNKRLKEFRKDEKFLPCKLFPSLNYSHV